MITRLLAFILILAAAGLAQDLRIQPKLVSFATEDGGTVFAHDYGKGKRGVVLVHGGRFNKESWREQAYRLREKGYRVLSIDLRGYGNSTGPGKEDIFSAPLYLDVLAAVRYLRDSGTKNVSLIGGSLGGGAASDAAITGKAGEIKGVLALGGFIGNKDTAGIRVPILVIMTRDDTSGSGPRLPGIQAGFNKVPAGNKELFLLDGTAHAQFMFNADIGEQVMAKIFDFLKKTNP